MNGPDFDDIGDEDPDAFTEDDCPVWYEMGYESEEDMKADDRKISLDKLRNRMRTW